MKLHLQATNLLPKNDFDLLRKVQFLRRLHSKTIANKIVRSNAFKNLPHTPWQTASQKH